MNKSKNNFNAGFSLIELIVAMTITLILLGIASALLTGALGIRERESQRTNALVSTQIALSSMVREIANCGYGLKDNGIVFADSTQQRLHIRTNLKNNDGRTDDQDEDITYFYDAGSQSIIRYDRFDNQGSVVVSQVSNLTFQYLDYSGSNPNPTVKTTPSANTGRIRIGVTVSLGQVSGQPQNQTVSLISDITLRNSNYILNQY